jgi:hypothetical protein
VSKDGGTTWDQAGISRVRFYVTLGNPATTPYETLVKLGCEGGMGAADPQDAVNRIWKQFADLNVKNAAGKQLTYYKNWNIAFLPDYRLYTKLLEVEDGQCGAWAGLWYTTLKAQGNDITFGAKPIARPTVNYEYFKAANPAILPAESNIGFLINDWTFVGRGPNGAGTSGVTDWPYPGRTHQTLRQLLRVA